LQTIAAKPQKTNKSPPMSNIIDLGLEKAKRILKKRFLILGKRFEDLNFEERMMIRNKIREMKAKTKFHPYSPVNVLSSMI
jgi:hypothetical protein